MNCKSCGSTRVIPYTYRPPVVGKKGPAAKRTAHACTPACDQTGTLCLNCRTVR